MHSAKIDVVLAKCNARFGRVFFHDPVPFSSTKVGAAALRLWHFSLPIPFFPFLSFSFLFFPFRPFTFFPFSDGNFSASFFVKWAKCRKCEKRERKFSTGDLWKLWKTPAVFSLAGCGFCRFPPKIPRVFHSFHKGIVENSIFQKFIILHKTSKKSHRVPPSFS